MPERVQLSRRKGWRKPDNTVVVARPSKWGNPFRLNDKSSGLVRYRPETPAEVDYEGRISAAGTRHDWFGADGTVVEYHVRWATRAEVVELFRATLFEPTPGMRMAYPSAGGHFARVTLDEIRSELAGKNLACWCPPDQPCHADVLLEIANGGVR